MAGPVITSCRLTCVPSVQRVEGTKGGKVMSSWLAVMADEHGAFCIGIEPELRSFAESASGRGMGFRSLVSFVERGFETVLATSTLLVFVWLGGGLDAFTGFPVSKADANGCVWSSFLVTVTEGCFSGGVVGCPLSLGERAAGFGVTCSGSAGSDCDGLADDLAAGSAAVPGLVTSLRTVLSGCALDLAFTDAVTVCAGVAGTGEEALGRGTGELIDCGRATTGVS